VRVVSRCESRKRPSSVGFADTFSREREKGFALLASK
jgi:hypothetical protein